MTCVKRPVRLLLGGAVLFLLCGCPGTTTDNVNPPLLDPGIDFISVDPVVQGDSPNVNVGVNIASVSNKYIRGATAEFRSTLESGRPWIAAPGEFTASASPNVWSGQLPALNLGPYEVRVTVNLRQGGANPDGSITPAIDEFISGVHAFSVGVDNEECFNFSASDNVQGWTHGGFKLMDGTDVSACSETLYIDNGALQSAISALCLPPQQFRFDLISPDLSSRPGWAQTEGTVISASSNLAQLQMQAIFQRLADNLPGLYVVDSNGNAVFHFVSSANATQKSFRIKLSPYTGSIDQLRIRYVGPPQSVAANAGFIQTFSACPIPDRPG